MLICAPVSAAIFLMVAPAGPAATSPDQLSTSAEGTSRHKIRPTYDLADQMARHNDGLVHLGQMMRDAKEQGECG